jgi:UDP-GlcNAc:undecaprenyl-phosphate/decaprenyl-phosphate GlcNAc-1-phosphate transferase
MKPDIIYSLLLFFGSFILSYALVPKIILVAKFKRLMDNPNERSSHAKATPSLGGIAFYVSIILSFYFLDGWDRFNIIPSLLPGLTILFVIGMKDDLTVLTPRTKFLSQVAACLFLLIHFKFKMHSLNGFVGIDHMNSYVSFGMALFLMLTIINSYNMIDGIDGLASIIGLVSFGFFAYLFFMAKSYFPFGLCLVIMGSLTAFLRYNTSHKMKIFMGDTGSMIIGFVAGGFAILLLSFPAESYQNLPIQVSSMPVIVCAVLILPLYDLVRVVIVRLINGKGPFSPDRNHIHHLLIDRFSISHIKASVILGVFSLLFGVLFIYLGFYFKARVLILYFLLALVIMTLILYSFKKGHKSMPLSSIDS